MSWNIMAACSGVHPFCVAPQDGAILPPLERSLRSLDGCSSQDEKGAELMIPVAGERSVEKKNRFVYIPISSSANKVCSLFELPLK